MDIPTLDQFVERCEAFCTRHGMAETRFGRDATGEPQLLASFRSGRSPSLKLVHRVVAFMARYEAESGVGSSGNEDELTGLANAARQVA